MTLSMPPAVMRRLMREIKELKSNPPEGIRIITSEENMLDVTGIIEGPEGTPYQGGYFKVRFKFTDEFPSAPPKCWFGTKIFHPNVSSAGEICVNTLKKDWSSTFGIAHILVTVKCLLIYPNPESALDEEAGKLLLEDYESYCERARLITSIHATPKVRPAEFNTPSAATKEAAAGSSKAIMPTTSLSPPTATNATSQISATSQKSGSPQPHSQPLQSTTTSNTPSLPPPISSSKDKERHVSPAPLSTADANLGAHAGTTPKTTAVVSGGSKAVKRSATGAAGTGAEKRKKALKRL